MKTAVIKIYSSPELVLKLGNLLKGSWVVQIELLINGLHNTALLLSEMDIGGSRWGYWLLLWALRSSRLLDSSISSGILALAGSLSGLFWTLWLGLQSMNSGHMITQVPMTWKSVPWDGPLTGSELAVKWLLAVSVHGMGLALVPEEAGDGCRCIC